VTVVVKQRKAEKENGKEFLVASLQRHERKERDLRVKTLLTRIHFALFS